MLQADISAHTYAYINMHYIPLLTAAWIQSAVDGEPQVWDLNMQHSTLDPSLKTQTNMDDSWKKSTETYWQRETEREEPGGAGAGENPAWFEYIKMIRSLDF